MEIRERHASKNGLELLKDVDIEFIRHAESGANAAPGSHFQSNAEVPLSKEGERQAEALAKLLGPSDLVLVSRYDRTLLTATPYLQKHPEIPVMVSPYLHEFNYLHPDRFIKPRAEGEKHPTETYWENQDIHFHDRAFGKDPQDLESFKEFITRVHQFIMSLKGILEHNPKNKRLKIFTHGVYIRAVYLLLTEFPDTFTSGRSQELVDTDIQRMMRRMGDSRDDENAIVATPTASVHGNFNHVLAEYWSK